MKIKCLVGTALLSMSAWTAFADVAQQQQQAPQQQQQQQQQNQKRTSGMSLSDLISTCQGFENDDQIEEFKSQFECRIRGEEVAQIGIQRFPLRNHKVVKFKEDIKAGKHSTDWSQVPGHTRDEEGTCPVYQKVGYTLARQVTLHSCAELPQSESAYCDELLEDDLAACKQEIAEGFQAGGFVADGVAHCQITEVFKPEACLDTDILPAPKPTCQQQQQQCQAQAQTQCQQQAPQAQTQCQAQAQTQCQTQAQDACVIEVAPLNMVDGVSFEEITVKKSVGHGTHRSIKVTSEPAVGSVLYKLGIHAGDIVSSIETHRAKTSADFVAGVEKANAVKKGHHVRAEFKSAKKNEWVKVKIKL